MSCHYRNSKPRKTSRYASCCTYRIEQNFSWRLNCSVLSAVLLLRMLHTCLNCSVPSAVLLLRMLHTCKRCSKTRQCVQNRPSIDTTCRWRCVHVGTFQRAAQNLTPAILYCLSKSVWHIHYCGCWQKDFPELSCLPKATRVIVPTGMRGAGRGGASGTCEGKEKCTEHFGWENLKERGCLEKQDINGRIILKWILKK